MFTNYQKISRAIGNFTIVVLLAVASLSFASVAHADYFATTTLTSTSSMNFFTVPAGVTSINATLTAGGGGGGGGAYSFGGGGGGAGGVYSVEAIPVIPGQIIAYTVGAGGVGGTSGFINVAGGNGADGGNTVLTLGASGIMEIGGKGGMGAIYGNSNSGKGGLAGGLGGTNGTNGDDQINTQRNYGGTGGSTPNGLAGIGGYGDANTYRLPTTGTNGAGGGAGSGWASGDGVYRDAGANGGDGSIVLSYFADLTASCYYHYWFKHSYTSSKFNWCLCRCRSNCT